MKKVFLVSTEDNEFVGVTPDLDTAKRLAREEFDCRYDRSDLRFEEYKDEWNSQRFWHGDVKNSILPIMIITEVNWFESDSRFPYEIEIPEENAKIVPEKLGDDVTFEIPNFLKRWAE